MSAAPPLPFKVDRLRAGRRVGLRHVLDQSGWDALAADPPPFGAAPLLGLWADGAFVNALFHEGRHRPVVTSVAPEGLRYRGLSARLPAAIPYERRIRDLHGLEAMSAADLRPILDHGAWTNDAPRAVPPGPPPRNPLPVEWVEGGDADEGSAHVECGPVGVPLRGLRLRATLAGSIVRRAELHVGTLHRGIAASVEGLPVSEACRRVERIDALSSVSHALCFSRAVEAALGTPLAASSVLLRVVVSEWERICAVATVLAEAADAAGCGLLGAQAMSIVATFRDVAAEVFGHRFAFGFVVPGGVSRPLDESARVALSDAAGALGRDGTTLARLYESRIGLARLLGASGVATAVDASALSAAGPVARASGLGFDARQAASGSGGGEPFATLSPTTEHGTADARFRLRIASLGQSAARIRAALDALVAMDSRTALATPVVPGGPADAIGVVEAPEGDLWHVLSLGPDGRVAGLFVRDPAVAHAALFERAAIGVRHELLPLVAHSFALRAEAIDQ